MDQFIYIPGVSTEVKGFWSLWEIAIHTDDWNCRRFMAIFLHDDGRVLIPTARHVWDQLLSISPKIKCHLAREEAQDVFKRMMKVAENQGNVIYDELCQTHKERLTLDRDKGEYAFSARRRAVERIGLPQVKNHRLALLEREEQEWRAALERRALAIPELLPLILIRIDVGGANG